MQQRLDKINAQNPPTIETSSRQPTVESRQHTVDFLSTSQSQSQSTFQGPAPQYASIEQKIPANITISSGAFQKSHNVPNQHNNQLLPISKAPAPINIQVGPPLVHANTQATDIQTHFMGPSSPDIATINRRNMIDKLRQEVQNQVNLIVKLNGKALNHMQRSEKVNCLNFLTKAEQEVTALKSLWQQNKKELGDIMDHIDSCRSMTMTFNNMGVFYKQEFKQNKAIQYLKMVVEIETEMFNCPTQKQDMAQSYINICSIYSEMGKHDIALHFIQKGVEILDQEYESRYPNNLGDSDEKEKFASVVSTAFHNAAVEYEFIGDYSSSLLHYQKAVKIAKIHLGFNNILTQTFENNFENAKTKITQANVQKRVKNSSQQNRQIIRNNAAAPIENTFVPGHGIIQNAVLPSQIRSRQVGSNRAMSAIRGGQAYVAGMGKGLTKVPSYSSFSQKPQSQAQSQGSPGSPSNIGSPGANPYLVEQKPAYNQRGSQITKVQPIQTQESVEYQGQPSQSEVSYVQQLTPQLRPLQSGRSRPNKGQATKARAYLVDFQNLKKKQYIVSGTGASIPLLKKKQPGKIQQKPMAQALIFKDRSRQDSNPKRSMPMLSPVQIREQNSSSVHHLAYQQQQVPFSTLDHQHINANALSSQSLHAIEELRSLGQHRQVNSIPNLNLDQASQYDNMTKKFKVQSRAQTNLRHRPNNLINSQHKSITGRKQSQDQQQPQGHYNEKNTYLSTRDVISQSRAEIAGSNNESSHGLKTQRRIPRPTPRTIQQPSNAPSQSHRLPTKQFAKPRKQLQQEQTDQPKKQSPPRHASSMLNSIEKEKAIDDRQEKLFKKADKIIAQIKMQRETDESFREKQPAQEVREAESQKESQETLKVGIVGDEEQLYVEFDRISRASSRQSNRSKQNESKFLTQHQLEQHHVQTEAMIASDSDVNTKTPNVHVLSNESYKNNFGVVKHDDGIEMARMFDAGSTASTRLIKLAFLKLYNRLQVKTIEKFLRKVNRRSAFPTQLGHLTVLSPVISNSASDFATLPAENDHTIKQEVKKKEKKKKNKQPHQVEEVNPYSSSMQDQADEKSMSEGAYSILDRIDQQNEKEISFKLVMGEQRKISNPPSKSKKKEVLVVRKTRKNVESAKEIEKVDTKAIGIGTNDDLQSKSALVQTNPSPKKINQGINVETSMVSEGIQATGNEIGTHMSIDSREQNNDNLILVKNESTKNRAYTTQDNIANELRVPGMPMDETPYLLHEESKASSRGEISISQGMAGLGVQSSAAVNSVGGLHEHNKDDKVPRVPRGSAYAGIAKSPYFNVDEGQPRTEEDQPILRQKTEVPKKIVGNQQLAIQNQGSHTNDRVSIGETSNEPDFYTNNDILTSPGHNRERITLLSNMMTEPVNNTNNNVSLKTNAMESTKPQEVSSILKPVTLIKTASNPFTPPIQEDNDIKDQEPSFNDPNSSERNNIMLHFDNADPSQVEKVPQNIEQNLRDNGKNYFEQEDAQNQKGYNVNGELIPHDILKAKLKRVLLEKDLKESVVELKVNQYLSAANTNKAIMEAIVILLKEEEHTETQEQVDVHQDDEVVQNESEAKSHLESEKQAEDEGLPLKVSAEQVVREATEDKTKDEKFKKIMQSYGKAVGKGDSDHSHMQQSDFDSAYEQLMMGAEHAKSQISEQQKLKPNKIYEEQLKKASQQIIMEKNEYSKFQYPADSSQHNYFSNRNRAQKALYEGSRKKPDSVGDQKPKAGIWTAIGQQVVSADEQAGGGAGQQV